MWVLGLEPGFSRRVVSVFNFSSVRGFDFETHAVQLFSLLTLIHRNLSPFHFIKYTFQKQLRKDPHLKENTWEHQDKAEDTDGVLCLFILFLFSDNLCIIALVCQKLLISSHMTFNLFSNSFIEIRYDHHPHSTDEELRHTCTHTNTEMWSQAACIHQDTLCHQYQHLSEDQGLSKCSHRNNHSLGHMLPDQENESNNWDTLEF